MTVGSLLAIAKIEVIQASPTLRDDLLSRVAAFLKMPGPRSDVISAVVDVLEERGVQTAVIEREYVDADYLQTYSQHYCKAFRPQSSLCQRIHFFSVKVEDGQLLTLSKEQKASYLGFCVVRPTGHQYVGRTVIAPPKAVVDGDGLVHARAVFDAHLLGQRLCVAGMPFIQQDVNTFICAGAALWSVALFLHRAIGSPRYYPGEITEIALEHFSNAQLREGLTTAQIVMTLREMGLTPHVKAFYSLQQLKAKSQDAHMAALAEVCDLLHVFADSGIPPILAYSVGGSGHAVAVAGHDVSTHTAAPSLLEPINSWVFASRYFVMDDAQGPYRRISAFGGGSGAFALEAADQLAVIAPVPSGVTIDVGDAQDQGFGYLKFWNDVLQGAATSNGDNTLLDHQLVATTGLQPVIRRVLMDSRRWKECVVAGFLPEWLRARYQAMLLPKYIWVLELSDWPHFNQPTHQARKICGEVILDATANSQRPFDSVLSYHVKGLLLDVSDATHPHSMRGPEPFAWYSPVCNPHG